MDKHFQKLAFTNQTTIDYWDKVYEQQDFYGDSFRKRMEKALSWLYSLRLSENSKILDIGCGTGRLASEAAKNKFTVFGIDFSYKMLEKANSLYNGVDKLNVPFLQGDINELPFDDSSIDMIICLGVITYLKSEEKAFRELARILTPDGVLVISFVNKARLIKHLDFPLFIKGIIQKMIGRIVFRKKSALTENDFSSKAYFIPDIQKSLEKVGFNIIDREIITLDLLSFYGREILPRKINTKISLFLDNFSNIPIIGSFGGMCMLEGRKHSL